ncbi:MAG: bifunctional (p)ppGpp synthetase/guanosine-3',5'-bis(diphosphate) 3'-pyrophosphohydrolase [Deltaproteobacteria bacterium]|nr:bifunctional (p)ppGpp synthetase/guanosine-3',5'-bis(diphosphate) 3'-pyrophosphohydrolase [Deltaproteobacteria bacterium]
MIRISDIIDKVSKHNPDADIDIIDRAYIYSARVHDGQMRLSGEPYLSHPLEVAGILADMKLDPVSIAAGLLHDVIEDTHSTPEEIQEMFGQEVVHIVSGVTKISVLSFNSSQARQAESIRKMILAMADDIRVILIKLADRLHNMRTLQFQKESKRKRIAQETLDIYVPLAARLGIYWIKNELGDILFKHLYPEEYANIERLISKDKKESDKYIEKVKNLIKKKMDEDNLKCQILGRYKNIFSIYQKMVKQNLPFEEVYDIIAFRIILDTVSDSYKALGLIHSLWKPVPKKIKDYIASPKPNMYQALHTTVIGPFGERIESISKKFAWIQNLVENQKIFSNPDEFLENVRIDLFPDEVYVFTPQGEIKSLPKGATPVDFAYQIHTEVGSQCTGAKVNGHIVPLKHELETGNIVEIITTKNHHPSKDWLNFVKTVKARSRIRQWIKTQEKDRSITLGREMCEKAFRKHRINFNELLKSEDMNTVIEHFGFKEADDLITSVGYGKITPLQIIRKITPKPETEKDHESIFNKIIVRVREKKPRAGIIVKGVDDILIRFGKCCQPVPGDAITGYITIGHGVTVHRTSCINALKMNPERQIDVEWNKDATETYPAKICVSSSDRVGLLADIAANISKSGANILNANTEIRENRIVDSFFTLAVEDIKHLDRVVSAIKKVKLVHDVKRV